MSQLSQHSTTEQNYDPWQTSGHEVKVGCHYTSSPFWLLSVFVVYSKQQQLKLSFHIGRGQARQKHNSSLRQIDPARTGAKLSKCFPAHSPSISPRPRLTWCVSVSVWKRLPASLAYLPRLQLHYQTCCVPSLLTRSLLGLSRFIYWLIHHQVEPTSTSTTTPRWRLPPPWLLT